MCTTGNYTFDNFYFCAEKIYVRGNLQEKTSREWIYFPPSNIKIEYLYMMWKISKIINSYKVTSFTLLKIQT